MRLAQPRLQRTTHGALARAQSGRRRSVQRARHPQCHASSDWASSRASRSRPRPESSMARVFPSSISPIPSSTICSLTILSALSCSRNHLLLRQHHPRWRPLRRWQILHPRDQRPHPLRLRPVASHPTRRQITKPQLHFLRQPQDLLLPTAPPLPAVPAFRRKNVSYRRKPCPPAWSDPIHTASRQHPHFSLSLHRPEQPSGLVWAAIRRLLRALHAPVCQTTLLCRAWLLCCFFQSPSPPPAAAICTLIAHSLVPLLTFFESVRTLILPRPRRQAPRAHLRQVDHQK